MKRAFESLVPDGTWVIAAGPMSRWPLGDVAMLDGAAFAAEGASERDADEPVDLDDLGDLDDDALDDEDDLDDDDFDDLDDDDDDDDDDADLVDLDDEYDDFDDEDHHPGPGRGDD